MTHCFDVALAQKYGLEEAIAIRGLAGWIKRNKGERANQVDGRTWTYNSYEQWVEAFPYWSPTKIRRVFDSLVDQDVIVKQQINLKKGDCRNWYAFADEALFLAEVTHLPDLPDGLAIPTDHLPKTTDHLANPADLYKVQVSTQVDYPKNHTEPNQQQEPASAGVGDVPDEMPDGTFRLTEAQLQALEALNLELTGNFTMDQETSHKYRVLFRDGLTVEGLNETVRGIIAQRKERDQDPVTSMRYFLRPLQRWIETEKGTRAESQGAQSDTAGVAGEIREVWERAKLTDESTYRFTLTRAVVEDSTDLWFATVEKLEAAFARIGWRPAEIAQRVAELKEHARNQGEAVVAGQMPPPIPLYHVGLPRGWKAPTAAGMAH